MIEILTFGLLLGFGAAIPIGPINLEIIRRNLYFGTPTGLALGIGACLADVTYLILLFYGVLQLFHSPFLLKTTGIIGSIVLAWFGWQALKQKSDINQNDQDVKTSSYTKHIYDGYFLTLINPYNIVFWSSVSATIAANTQVENAMLYAGLGVLVGVVSWIIGLNSLLHFTRNRISNRIMNKINFVGGLILIALAIATFWRTCIA